MTDPEIRSEFSSKTALALTIWGEARSEPIESQIAVGWVCRNRLSDPGKFEAHEQTYKAICLAPNQFSCWSAAGGAVNYASIMALAEKVVSGLAWKDPLLTQAMFLADGIIGGILLDNTKCATMYYAPASMTPLGTVPVWAQNRNALVIGGQHFFTV